MFTTSDIYEGICTTKQYVDQFHSVKPMLGKVYTQAPGQWDETKYKIVFVDDRIAVGMEVAGTSIKAGAAGKYCLFYSSGLYCGWKYQDTARPYYRLKVEEL